MTHWNRRAMLVAAGSGVLAAAGCAGAPGRGGGVSLEPGISPPLFYLGRSRVFEVRADGDRPVSRLGRNKVFALLAEGGSPVALVEEPEGRGGLYDGIALDLLNGHIYWTDMGRPNERDGSVHRCDLDGQNVVTIVAPGGTHTPKQLKIDSGSGKLYWSDREGMAVMRANLDGSDIETIVVTGNPVANAGDQSLWCVGMALDPARGHVYWTQKGGDNSGRGMIRRCNMEMPAGERANTRTDIRNLFTRLPEPIDLDLDLTSRTIYWTDRGDETVSRAPMDPPQSYDPAKRLDREIILRGLGEAIGVAIDLERDRLAWTNLEGDVGIARLDGSGKRMLASGQGLLTGIAWAT